MSRINFSCELEFWLCQNSFLLLGRNVVGNRKITQSEMLVDYIEALVEIFPTCKAILINNSGKMLDRGSVLTCDMPQVQSDIVYI